MTNVVSVIVDPPMPPRVAGDRATIECQCRMIVMDTSTRSGGSVGDGQARNGHSFTQNNVKYGTLAIAIHCEVLSARS